MRPSTLLAMAVGSGLLLVATAPSAGAFQGEVVDVACARAVATALPGGGVQLDWEPVGGAGAYFVYRSAGGEEPELLATVEAAEPGVLSRVVATLPRPLTVFAAAESGGKVYVFGGATHEDPELDAILRFNPATQEVTQVARLPWGMHAPVAATVGDAIFIAGGWDGNRHRDEVVRFDPATGASEVVARLPSPRSYLTAAVVEGQVYFFGGDDGVGQVLDEVLRFDPVANVVETLPERLPFPREVMATLYDGTHVWLLGGGIVGGDGADDAIVRFDPASGEAQEVALTLPEPRSRLTGVTEGRYLYVLGGRTGAQAHDDVLRFDPLFGELRPLEPGLPEPRANGVAVRVGDRAYYFGGSSPVDTSFVRSVLELRFQSASATTYTDRTTAEGQVYGYRVAADVGEVPEGGCPEAAVTAIPDLPGVALLLGAAGGVAAYAARRR